ncbi:helix-turn-helix domain-containing protein, partial [Facklamia hominis]|uniref:helix-turn-helix domain-containing protein n=1 Tax=Facklamia hominis TaxID=178214 RepID=UPI00288A8080
MLWEKMDKLMKDRGMNQVKLAQKMGVFQSVISALKRGKIKKPSFELVCKLADALEVDINEFREEG